MYVALKYVTVGRRFYTPGETFEEDKNAAFHLKIKAIKEIPDAADIQEEELPKWEKTEPVHTPTPDPEPTTEPEPEPEEIEYEEPEAPEIDVMDAVVSKPAQKAKSRRESKK